MCECQRASQGRVHNAELLKRECCPERKPTPRIERAATEKPPYGNKREVQQNETYQTRERNILRCLVCLPSLLTIRSLLSFVDFSWPSSLSVFSTLIWFLEIRVLSRGVTDSCLCLNESWVGGKKILEDNAALSLTPSLYHAPIINSHTYLQH